MRRRLEQSIVHGDNVEVLEKLYRKRGEFVSLAYLDPPFNTNRVHKTSDGEIAFDDRWSSISTYISALQRTLGAVRTVLLPHGSVIIHIDPKMSHYVKLATELVFEHEAFASEIVWRYRRWPTKTLNFQRVHDVLLRYRKDPKVSPRWNQLYEPLAPSTVATWGTCKQRAIVAGGKRTRSSRTEEASKGVPMGDVWDIPIVAPVARERTGYPSQKPEALLERLVASLTDPGDTVLDPYMGSGTTGIVAKRLRRHSISIDSSPVAIKVASERMRRRRVA